MAQENGRPLAKLGNVQTNAVRFDRSMADIPTHWRPLVSTSFRRRDALDCGDGATAGILRQIKSVQEASWTRATAG
jgi:hypothetical protein